MSNLRIDPGSFSGFAPSRETRTVRGVARRTDKGTLLLRRWAGCWIDFIALFLIVMAFGGLAQLHEWFVLVGFIPLLGYFPVCEWLWGKTLGKLVTGLVVVNDKGRPPGIRQAIVRTLFRLIEVNPFFFGGIPAGIMVAVTEHRQRLGDLVSGTYVILAEDVKYLSPDTTIAEVFD